MYTGELTGGHSLQSVTIVCDQVNTKETLAEPPPRTKDKCRSTFLMPQTQKYPSRTTSSSCVLIYLVSLRLGHVDMTHCSGKQVLQRQYEKEQELGHVTSQTKFNYAWGLVKSPNKEQQVEGIGLLQGRFPTYLSSNRRSDSGIILGIRFVPYGCIPAERMPLLSGAWLLQVAELRTGTKVQWYVHIPIFSVLCLVGLVPLMPCTPSVCRTPYSKRAR